MELPVKSEVYNPACRIACVSGDRIWTFSHLVEVIIDHLHVHVCHVNTDVTPCGRGDLLLTGSLCDVMNLWSFASRGRILIM